MRNTCNRNSVIFLCCRFRKDPPNQNKKKKVYNSKEGVQIMNNKKFISSVTLQIIHHTNTILLLRSSHSIFFRLLGPVSSALFYSSLYILRPFGILCPLFLSCIAHFPFLFPLLHTQSVEKKREYLSCTVWQLYDWG